MREAKLTIPEISLIAGTRVALGVGAGLLLADKFSEEKRRAVGWSLLLAGIATTFPLAANVLCKSESVRRKKGSGKLFKR